MILRNYYETVLKGGYEYMGQIAIPASGGGTTLPPMPTSESTRIEASTTKKWCEIKKNTSTIHVRKPSGQTSTLNLTAEMLLSDGSIRSSALAVHGTQWNTLSINTTDAIACNLYYGGSTGATFYIYFS